MNFAPAALAFAALCFVAVGYCAWRAIGCRDLEFGLVGTFLIFVGLVALLLGVIASLI